MSKPIVDPAEVARFVERLREKHPALRRGPVVPRTTPLSQRLHFKHLSALDLERNLKGKK